MCISMLVLYLCMLVYKKAGSDIFINIIEMYFIVWSIIVVSDSRWINSRLYS